MTLFVFSIILILLAMYVLPQFLPDIATPVRYIGYAGLLFSFLLTLAKTTHRLSFSRRR
jgi:hypothetical protein